MCRTESQSILLWFKSVFYAGGETTQDWLKGHKRYDWDNMLNNCSRWPLANLFIMPMTHWSTPSVWVKISPLAVEGCSLKKKVGKNIGFLDFLGCFLGFLLEIERWSSECYSWRLPLEVCNSKSSGGFGKHVDVVDLFFSHRWQGLLLSRTKWVHKWHILDKPSNALTYIFFAVGH